MITIGIPFYNSEKYIKELLISIKNQTFKDFNIIFVDNNSKDNSRKIIIDSLQGINYKIINEYKQGIAYCRNDILDNVDDYVVFVDSDDILSPNYILELNKLSKEADLGIVGVKFFQKELPNLNEINDSTNVILGNEYRKSYVYTKDICLWNKIFSKKIILENNIRFDTSLLIGEDADFVLKYGQFVKNVAISQSKLYFYRETDSSTYGKFISSNNGEKICKSLVKLYSDFKLKLDNESYAFIGCSEFETYYLKKLYMFYKVHDYKKEATAVKKEIKTILKDLLKKDFLNIKHRFKIILKLLFLTRYLNSNFRK